MQEYVGGDKNYSLTITIHPPERWEEWKDFYPLLKEKFEILFKYGVYDCHKYLIRATPMRTGRLRGGWTAFLNKHSIDYSAAFMDVTLVTGHNEPLDSSAIREGMELSSVMETESVVTIINGVPYADYVESGTSKMEGQYFTRKAMYKSELIMKNYLESWALECSESGDIVEPKQMEEVQI